MITVIRRSIKSQFFKYVLWFFVILFAIVFLMPNLGDQLSRQQWLARVNGTEISGTSFMRTISKHEANMRILREQYGEYAGMFMQMLGLNQNPQVAAYQELVRDTLLNNVAQDIPIYINREYIDEKFNDPLFIQQSGVYNLLPLGFFSPEGIEEQALQFYLSRMNLSFSHFETLVEEAMARHMVLELAGLATYTPGYIYEDALLAELAKRNYAVVRFSFDDVVKQEQKKEINDDDLQAFFQAKNKAEKKYWVPEKRAGLVWRFDPTSYGIDISYDDIKDYYDKHKVRKYIASPAQVQVRRILFKISDTEPKELSYQRAQTVRAELVDNPDAFDEKARELSEDEQTAQEGGLVPYFSKGDRNPVFEKKSFLLKDGQISEVFQTEDGFEIVKRVGFKPKEYTPVKKVKDEIREILLKQEFAKQFSKDMKALIDRSGVDEKALQEFVKQKKSKPETVSLKSKDDSRLMQTLFRMKKDQADFFVEGDTGYIVQLNEIQNRYLPQLSSIRDAVKNDLIDDRAHKSLKKKLEHAQEALDASPAKEVAYEHGASYQETDFIDANDTEKLENLSKKDIPTQQMLQLEKKGASTLFVDKDAGFLISVLDIQEPDKQVIEEKKAAVENRVHNERKGLFVQGFVASLSRNATIETNKSVFTLNEA